MKFGSDYRGMGQYMTMGIQMVVVTIVGAGIGYWLDKRTGREPLFLILFFLLGAFAVFFVAVSVWAVRKLKPDLLTKAIPLNEDALQPESLAALLPAGSAILPFLLLIMATLRLQLANPSPVFGLALLLTVLLLGLTRMIDNGALPMVAFAVMKGAPLAALLQRTSELLGKRPWGIGLLGFAAANWASPQTPAPGYAFAAAIFWLFCFSMSRYSIYTERRLHTGHKR